MAIKMLKPEKVAWRKDDSGDQPQKEEQKNGWTPIIKKKINKNKNENNITIYFHVL